MENRSLDNIIKSSLENFEVECTPQDWAFMEDMLTAEQVAPIDEAAKSELQNMEVPFDATVWLAMESALDNLELEEIDEAVKSALEDFETPYKPDDWSVMEQKIEAELPHAVDELAKSALGEYSVPFVPIHWAMMDIELDDLGFPNETDDAVKAALQQYESAQPSNWAAMEASLVEVENVRHQLILTKSIELVLFIFAIWTIGNFLPFNHKSSNAVVPPTEIVEEENASTNVPQANNRNSASDLTESSEMNIASINDLGEPNLNDNISETKTPILNINSNIDVTTANPLLEIPENKNTPLWIDNLPKQITPEISKDSKVENTNQTKEVIATTQPLAVISAEDLVTYGEDKKGPTFSIDKKKNSNVLTVASFVERKTPKLVFEPSENFVSNISSKNLTSPVHLKASVNTQYANFIENDKSQSARGLATYLGIDYIISDKIEISTGFVYNNKSYSYRNLEPFVNANSPKVVEIERDVKLDILQIPLRLNFNFRKNKKARLYAIAGITPGLIIKEDTRNTNSSLINDVTPGTYRNILVDNGNDNMLTGTQEGTSNNNVISARTFATADAGLGLEYKTNSRFSFFIEPLFQHSIGGLGNDNEKYKNYSLALGSRVIL
ncbi:MAG: hypothetical protein AB8G11_02500 [Saprospiraceae bacterium]